MLQALNPRSIELKEIGMEPGYWGKNQKIQGLAASWLVNDYPLGLISKENWFYILTLGHRNHILPIFVRSLDLSLRMVFSNFAMAKT